MADLIRIVGIDPGSRTTGYGIVDSDGYRTQHVASGCVNARDTELAVRLRTIYRDISSVIGEYEPDHLAIERVFVNRNAESALKLGQARAAAICATFEAEIPVYEYAARAVKQAVVGRGGADKYQVQRMVAAILNLDQKLGTDEADALAVAICHAHSMPVKTRVKDIAISQGEATA